jgi:hypothetical protein
VLEVGLTRYEFVPGGVNMIVCAKLIDPATGAVLGRGKTWRQYGAPGPPSGGGGSAAHATAFAEAFTRASQELIDADLRGAGLLPPPPPR